MSWKGLNARTGTCLETLLAGRLYWHQACTCWGNTRSRSPLAAPWGNSMIGSRWWSTEFA